MIVKHNNCISLAYEVGILYNVIDYLSVSLFRVLAKFCILHATFLPPQIIVDAMRKIEIKTRAGNQFRKKMLLFFNIF